MITAVTVVSMAACSGDDDGAGTDATSDPATAPATEPTAATEPSEPTDPDPAPTPTVSDVTDPSNDEVEDDSTTSAPTTVALIDGFEATIELLTPLQGSGIRPLLEWAPVDDAARYMVVVYAPDGSPYWASTSAATSVHVGGDPVLTDDRPGPSVIDGMSWGVVALDDETVPISFSDRRPIAP